MIPAKAKASNDLCWFLGSLPKNIEKRMVFKTATSDWRVLVKDPAVEAIIIATPQIMHREIAIAAFAEGKPVFCEKPLGIFFGRCR